MESNQAEPSPQPTPPPPPHTASQVVWPPHSQPSYEIADAPTSSQYSEDVQHQVDYQAESTAGVQDYSSNNYPERFSQTPTAVSAVSSQMIRTISYEQGAGQSGPFSPQPSTSNSGAYQVRVHPRHRLLSHHHHHLGSAVHLQNYERISPVDEYQNSPAPSSEDHLHQYETISHLAEQSDQVSSAVRMSQAMTPQSHISITMTTPRASSPSAVNRGPSPLTVDHNSADLQAQRMATSPLTAMSNQRIGNGMQVSSRYISSDMVESSMNGHSLSLGQNHHHKDLLVDAVSRSMVVNQLANSNHILALQSQRISSPVNMVVSQSQRLPSPTSIDYGGLHPGSMTLNRAMGTIHSVGVPHNQRSVSPSQRYSPVHLRPMATGSPMMASTSLTMQNYVSSSTGSIDGTSASNLNSSGAVIDSTVDSTVETTDARLGTADDVVGSSSTAYISDLDGDGLDTTHVNKILQMHSMNMCTDGIHLATCVSVGSTLPHLRPEHLDTIANSRPRRHLHKQRMPEQDQQRCRTLYPTKEFWCDECHMAYDMECTRHRIQTIFDKPVLSRAWASLPGAYLAINKVGITEAGQSVYGVFAKKSIPRRTKFGPVEGVITKGDEILPLDVLILQIETETGEFMWVDTSDESMSNWMRFVRPAENYTEQNLVVIQSEESLYFLSTKQINPRTELKVWYSQQYAERRGLKVNEPDEEELKAMEDQENAWPCFECNSRFPSSDELQKHLNDHDMMETTVVEDSASSSRKKNRPRGRPTKKSKGRPKKLKVPLSDGDMEDFDAHDRHVRRHKARGETEVLARPMKSLFKKKQAEGTEWVCTHCDLTFDNSSLLNLHTLTHAAENVGLEEVARFAVEPDFTNGSDGDYKEDYQDLIENGTLKCPECTQEFICKKDLIDHASAHGKMIMRKTFRGMINPAKPFKCELCYKSFASEDRLMRHHLVHGSEESKPLQCDICFKRFLNNSALACHIKVHSDEKKYYECPICKEGFDQIILLKDHVHIHCISGVYTCPSCQKGFEEYNQIRKHIRAFHSEKRYPCEQCDKVFPRPDKLKLHMLRHSDHREFLCANCGKQFKRKDKLKEHMKRMHSAEREARLAMKPLKPTSSKKFIPKVSPTDYHRFIYKCHTCLLGFKRRGMLVNHLAKRHPDIRPESVPELNLPILKTTRDYYCQYCEKVYKSSSKRKAHILKNHPGAELPMSNRRKVWGGIPEIPGLPNPTFSQTVGSITTHPHNCDWCHKQYASKAKLLQHQRKKHLDLLPQVGASFAFQSQPIPRNHHRDLSTQYQVQITTTTTQTSEGEFTDGVVIDATKRKTSTPAPRPPSVYMERDTHTPAVPPHTTVDSLQAADLLTQAMSELTQTLNEYRPSAAEFHLARMSQSGPPTMVPPSPATTPIPQSSTPMPNNSTIEQSHLGQILAHYQTQQPQGSLSPGPQPSPSPSPAPANYVPRTWANTFANYPAR